MLQLFTQIVRQFPVISAGEHRQIAIVNSDAGNGRLVQLHGNAISLIYYKRIRNHKHVIFFAAIALRRDGIEPRENFRRGKNGFFIRMQALCQLRILLFCQQL